MPILESWYLHNVELLEGGLKILEMGNVGYHLGVSGLVGTKKLVYYQLEVRTT